MCLLTLLSGSRTLGQALDLSMPQFPIREGNIGERTEGEHAEEMCGWHMP